MTEMYCSVINDKITTSYMLLSNFNLKLSVPNGLAIGGLQSSQYGRLLKFISLEKYIQVLHIDGNHWITMSNIDMGQDTAVADVN